MNSIKPSQNSDFIHSLKKKGKNFSAKKKKRSLLACCATKQSYSICSLTKAPLNLLISLSLHLINLSNEAATGWLYQKR